jgi:hypothetical protein
MILFPFKDHAQRPLPGVAGASDIEGEFCIKVYSRAERNVG